MFVETPEAEQNVASGQWSTRPFVCKRAMMLNSALTGLATSLPASRRVAPGSWLSAFQAFLTCLTFDQP